MAAVAASSRICRIVLSLHATPVKGVHLAQYIFYSMQSSKQQPAWELAGASTAADNATGPINVHLALIAENPSLNTCLGHRLAQLQRSHISAHLLLRVGRAIVRPHLHIATAIGGLILLLVLRLVLLVVLLLLILLLLLLLRVGSLRRDTQQAEHIQVHRAEGEQGLQHPAATTY